MAAKKHAATKPETTNNLPAVPKPGKTDVGAPLDWEQQLAKYAQRSAKVAEAMSSGGNWITFKSGVLAYKGMPLKNNEVELIVLDEVLENIYYEGRFDPDTPASPVCFALARELGEMRPHAESPEPQHETCKGCQQNAFGSSDSGKGKACKNIVRLAVIAWGDGSLEQIKSCELAFAKLPVTSVKNWGSYTKSLREKLNSPPFAAITRMYVEPDAKTQFQVRFDLVEKLDKKLGGAVLARVIEAEKEIIPANPYPPFERDEKPATKGRAAKATSKKY